MSPVGKGQGDSGGLGPQVWHFKGNKAKFSGKHQASNKHIQGHEVTDEDI